VAGQYTQHYTTIVGLVFMLLILFLPGGVLGSKKQLVGLMGRLRFSRDPRDVSTPVKPDQADQAKRNQGDTGGGTPGGIKLGGSGQDTASNDPAWQPAISESERRNRRAH
jgi:hypothetical protein